MFPSLRHARDTPDLSVNNNNNNNSERRRDTSKFVSKAVTRCDKNKKGRGGGLDIQVFGFFFWGGGGGG